MGLLTLIIAAVALVTGWLGFRGYVASRPDYADSTFADLLYYTTQLFVLGPTPFSGGSYDLNLQFARFLAPLATVLAVLQAFALLFGDWVTAIYARRKSGHAIVVGDGPAAALLAERLLAKRRVVVLMGGAVPKSEVRGQRLLVLAGEPTDAITLKAAGLDRATSVYAVSNSRVVNAAVALAVSNGGRHDVRVFARVEDELLVAALRARHRTDGHTGRLPEFVSLAGVAARVLLDDHPPGYLADKPREVVIAGTGPFALAVLRELGRRQRQARVRRHVSVVTAQQAVVTAVAAEPGMEFLDIDTTTASPTDDGESAVYVCYVDPDQVLRAGLGTRPAGSGAVLLCLERLAGLGEALNGQRVLNAARITVFGILDTACDPKILERDLYAQIGRAIHADYVQNQRAEGADASESQVPWESLEKNLRADNVQAAVDVEDKLDAIRADLMPLGPDLGTFAFTSTEIEMLARREHDRWMDAKVADGFRWGEQRTETTRPDLRPWDDLDEAARNKDIRMIMNLPTVLADAGLQIARRP